MSSRNYGKIIQGIFDSSIMSTGPVNRAIFMDSVVLAESDSVVHMSLGAFSRRTGWSLEQVREAAKVHMSPDLESSSKEHEGRRWLWVDPKNESKGFLVVNRDKYKASFDSEERKRYKRDWMKLDRARRKFEETRKEGLARIDSIQEKS